jgi:hypothetical protein
VNNANMATWAARITLMWCAAFSMRGAVLFSEDFENGLGQWTGRAGGGFSGRTVADPLGSGRGQVLTFSNLANGGDIFSRATFSTSNALVLSFDYLGFAGTGSQTNDLGGFLGICLSYNPQEDRVDHVWVAGTSLHYAYTLPVDLVDDGVWHRYSMPLVGLTNGVFHLMIEDWTGSGGIPGDAFFDNILVEEACAPERLSVDPSGTNVFISWSASGCDFVLEATTTLPETNAWTVVTNVPVLNGDRYAVTLPVAEPAGFFRLRRR